MQDLQAGLKGGGCKKIGNQRNPESLGLGDAVLNFMSQSVSSQNPGVRVHQFRVSFHGILAMRFKVPKTGEVEEYTSWLPWLWSNPHDGSPGLHPRHKEIWVHRFPASRSFR